MATIEVRGLPLFTDTLGRPLESGSIYIGQAGLNPIVYPQTATSDAAGSLVLAQPIRTVHGRVVVSGALSRFYTVSPYSITILDGSGRVVYTSLSESS